MNRLDSRALRSVILVLDRAPSEIGKDILRFLEGYGEVGVLLITSYMQSDGMVEDDLMLFVKFVAQALLITDTVEINDDDDYFAIVDAIADASTSKELWHIIEDNFLAGHDALYEFKFTSLADFIIYHEELFVRKLSDEDIEAYDCGEDEYGDIVNWAERQLAVDVEDTGEDVETWYEEEYNTLKTLVKVNLK